MPRPKEADSAETYERILSATLRVLEEQRDPKMPSLRTVAERAGVSLGTLHYYFATKDDLVEASLDGYYERLGELGSRLIDDVGRYEGRELVERAVDQMFRFARQERGLLRLRVASTSKRGELHPTRQREFMGSMAEHAVEALRPHLQVAEGDARLAIHAMSALVARFALMSDSEMSLATGKSGAAAADAIADYVVRAGRRLVRPMDG